jgi:L-iditol 2-dehydrogenase
MVGICGSDLSQLAHNLEEVSIGHEWVGEVQAVGSEISSYKPGDLVTSVANTSCGLCGPCQKGHYENCQRPQLLGRGLNSVLSSQITLREADLLKAPQGLSPLEFSLLEVSYIGDCAFMKAQALGLKGPNQGDKVIIFGAGPIGLFSALSFKLRGYQPIVVETVKERIKSAQELGFETLSFAELMLKEEYLASFDFSIDCTGDNGGPGAMQILPMFTKAEGGVVIVGKYLKTPFKDKLFIKKSLKVTWVANHKKQDFLRSIEFWKNPIKDYADKVIKTFPISEINQAFQEAQGRKVMKCLLLLD